MIPLLALWLLSLSMDDKQEEMPPKLAPVGTVWEGTYKAVEVSVSTTGRRSTKRVTSDLRIEVTQRKGEKFTGVFWLDNGKKGYTIEGTIDGKGAIAFKYTKKLKGSWPSDMVDNAVVKGLLRRDELVARFAKGGNEQIVGDIVAKIKKEE